MVHNTIGRNIVLPFGRSTTRPSKSGNMVGRGGSILLQRGGAGSASSYNDMDQYIKDVGFDSRNKRVLEGTGISKSLEEKLKRLTINKPSDTKRNIVM